MPLNEGEERMILAHADTEAGIELRAALTDQHVARNHELTAKALDAEALRVRVAAVAGRAGTFFGREELKVEKVHSHGIIADVMAARNRRPPMGRRRRKAPGGAQRGRCRAGEHRHGMVAPSAEARAARTRRAATVVALVALSAYLVLGPLRAPRAFVRDNAIDFVAAYCGTVVAAGGADPYRIEPLRSCEATQLRPGAFEHPWVVVPAPLPGYTFVVLRPFASLPFGAAKSVYLILSAGALVVTAACAALVMGLPLAGVLLAFTPTVGLLNLYYGEPIPFAVAFIGAAALCAARGRDRAAGTFAALALLEPHVGLGAFAGVFVALPRARVQLIVTAAALGVAGVAELRIGPTVEYLRAVLPAQALSEIGVNYQLSFSHLLALLGVPPRPALLAGSLSYGVMLVCGVLAGRIFAARGVRAAAVYLPVTFTMLGGTYVHTPEIAAALPGVLLLCTQLRGAAGVVTAVALALLVVPWNVGILNATPLPLALAAVFVATALARERGRAALSGAALLTAALALYIALLPPGTGTPRLTPATANTLRPDDLAARAWSMYVGSTHWLLAEDPRRIMLKAPQWLGLVLAVGAAVTACRARRPVPAQGLPGSLRAGL